MIINIPVSKEQSEEIKKFTDYGDLCNSYGYCCDCPLGNIDGCSTVFALIKKQPKEFLVGDVVKLAGYDSEFVLGESLFSSSRPISLYINGNTYYFLPDGREDEDQDHPVLALVRRP